MSQNKKSKTQYNLWTMPAGELHKGLKSIKINANKLDSLSTESTEKKSDNTSGSSALKFSSSGHTPLFGRLKRA